MLPRHNELVAGRPIACVLLTIFLASTAWPQQATRSFSAGRLRLQDALDSTLEQHPTAELQRLQVQIAQGARMQTTGQFDTYFGSSLKHSLTNDPLTQNEQQQAQQAGISASKLAGNLSSYSFSQN